MGAEVSILMMESYQEEKAVEHWRAMQSKLHKSEGIGRGGTDKKKEQDGSLDVLDGHQSRTSASMQ